MAQGWYEDLTGRKFNDWIVIRRENGKWLCRCKCGYSAHHTGSRLRSGQSKCCAICSKEKQKGKKQKSRPIVDLTGQRFGTRIITGCDKDKTGHHIYHLKCDCGEKASITKSNLKTDRCRVCEANKGNTYLPYLTYLYFDENKIPRYVGCGNERRPYIDKCRPYPTPKNISQILILKRFESKQDAVKHEIYMIAVLGRECDGTGPLKNISPGGGFADERTKKKITEAKLGKEAHNKGKRRSLVDRISNSKYEYVVITPYGERTYVPLLRDYAEDQGLSYRALSYCSKGNQVHHRGYRVERYLKGTCTELLQSAD